MKCKNVEIGTTYRALKWNQTIAQHYCWNDWKKIREFWRLGPLWRGAEGRQENGTSLVLFKIYVHIKMGIYPIHCYKCKATNKIVFENNGMKMDGMHCTQCIKYFICIFCRWAFGVVLTENISTYVIFAIDQILCIFPVPTLFAVLPSRSFSLFVTPLPISSPSLLAFLTLPSPTHTQSHK